jgi:hypothetical protein
LPPLPPLIFMPIRYAAFHDAAIMLPPFHYPPSIRHYADIDAAPCFSPLSILMPLRAFFSIIFIFIDFDS